MTTSLRPRHALQRGSILVNAAIVLSLAVILLIGTELGYQFYIKREFQKAADLAALAGAQNLTSTNCAPATAAALSNANDGASRNLPVGFSLAGGDVTCGTWAANATGSPDKFTASSSGMNAVRIRLTRSVPPVIAFSVGAQTISVQAVAAKALPQANLTIRSTLITIDSSKAALLNAIVGGMLGGSVNISAAGWQALVGTNLNLLNYLVQLGGTAGNYSAVLNASTSASQLLNAALTVLQQSGNTASLALDAFQQLSAAATVGGISGIKLGELIGVATGTPDSALNLNLQAFQLVQAMAQLSNGQHAVAVTIPAVTVPGVAGVTGQVMVIEKPQLSAIGNPDLINASQGTSDPNRIYVQTAQVRTLLSVNLTGLNNVVSQLNTLVAPLSAGLGQITNFLTSVASLNLTNLVPALVGVVACGSFPLPACTVSKVTYATVLPNAKIDVNIDAAAGTALVTNHTCISDISKSLTAAATTKIGNVRVGTVANAFSSSVPITVAPVSLVELGYRNSKADFCALSALCIGVKYENSAGVYVSDIASARLYVKAGLGLKLDAPIAPSSKSLTYTAPAAANLPALSDPAYSGGGADPSYQAITTQSLVTSLATTLGGIQVQAYQSDPADVLSSLLVGTVSLINGLLSTVQSLVGTALGPLLDPAVNALLDALGLDLAKSEVGARMSCSSGVELVY